MRIPLLILRVKRLSWSPGRTPTSTYTKSLTALASSSKNTHTTQHHQPLLVLITKWIISWYSSAGRKCEAVKLVAERRVCLWLWPGQSGGGEALERGCSAVLYIGWKLPGGPQSQGTSVKLERYHPDHRPPKMGEWRQNTTFGLYDCSGQWHESYSGTQSLGYLLVCGSRNLTH